MKTKVQFDSAIKSSMVALKIGSGTALSNLGSSNAFGIKTIFLFGKSVFKIRSSSLLIA